MKIDKEFITLGRSFAIVIPMAWIKSQEKEHGKKMIGVIVDVNDALTLVPMWGPEETENPKK